MSNTQYYSKADAENILETANNYVSNASKSAHIANKYINRDANAKINQYEGQHSQLNNQLVKVGHEYVYITQGGVARKVTGGVGSPWSLQGNAGDNDQYSRFSDVPNSDCPADVTVISDFDSINDIKVNSISDAKKALSEYSNRVLRLTVIKNNGEKMAYRFR